jgi:hypothetical protein
MNFSFSQLIEWTNYAYGYGNFNVESSKYHSVSKWQKVHSKPQEKKQQVSLKHQYLLQF